MNKNLYESLDGGYTVSLLGQYAAGQATQLIYGGRLNGQDNPDLIYSGAGNQLYYRYQPGGPFFTSLYNSSGGATIQGMVADRDDWRVITVVDSNGDVWTTTNVLTAPFTKLTFNLGSFTTDPLSIEQVLAQDGQKVLLVGAGRPTVGANGVVLPDAATGGIYQLFLPDPTDCRPQSPSGRSSVATCRTPRSPQSITTIPTTC